MESSERKEQLTCWMMSPAPRVSHHSATTSPVWGRVSTQCFLMSSSAPAGAALQLSRVV